MADFSDLTEESRKARAERERIARERAEDVERHPAWEELDPDAIRRAPAVDEEGDIVEDEDIEEILKGQ